MLASALSVLVYRLLDDRADKDGIIAFSKTLVNLFRRQRKPLIAPNNLHDRWEAQCASLPQFWKVEFGE